MAKSKFTATDFIANHTKPSGYTSGEIVEFIGWSSSGDGGAAQWKSTGNVIAASQTPVDLGGARLSDASGNEFELVYAYKLELIKLGFTDITKEQRTALVQGLFDNNWQLLSGIELISPEGVYEFSSSTLVETWTNDLGGTVAADGACLVLRKHCKITGAGRDDTSWFCSDATKTLMFVDNGSFSTIRDIELRNIYTGVESGAGHGVFNLVKNLDDTVNGFTIERARIKNVASYGLGLNYGYQTNCSITDIEIDTTGADGVDIKSRSTGLEINKVNTINKLRCKNFGLRLDGQVGLDVRGQYSVNDVWITEFGDGIKLHVGIRLRPLSIAPNLAFGTVCTNVHMLAGNSVKTSGIEIAGENNKVIGFTVADCEDGVNSYEGSDNIVSNGTVSGHTGYGIRTTVSSINLNVSNVRCINANSATAHFRVEGAGWSSRNVSGDSSATEWSIATAANGTISRDTSNNNEVDGFDFLNITAGRVGIRAQGNSDNIDIALSPKGSGKVRIGDHAALGAEVVTGYIEIKDSAGVPRKLAVVS